MFPQSFQYAPNAAPAVTTASRAPLLFEAPAVGHHIHHQSEHEDWRAGAAGAAAAQATVLRQAQFGTAANLRMASNDTVASWRLPNVVRTRRDMNQQRHRSSSNTYDGASARGHLNDIGGGESTSAVCCGRQPGSYALLANGSWT